MKKPSLKLLTSYVASEIAENNVEDIMENWSAEGFDEKPTREQALHYAYGKPELYEFAWEDMLNDLEDEMKRRNPGGYWYAEVKNFGWQSRSGHKFFGAKTARHFLQNILPDTENSFKIYAWGKNGLAINNAHHDSPTWAEWYYVRPATAKEIENEEFK